MTEAEATQRSKELNAQLGAAGEERDFYMPVQGDDGAWGVVRQSSPPTNKWVDRILRLLNFTPP